MKIKLLGMARILIPFLALAAAASAFDISDDLRLAIQRDVEAVEQDGPRMGDAMAALREIGASYLPELMPPTDVDRFQTAERRRLAVGAYLMDLTYAATFDQREPAARFGQALYELLDRLGFPDPHMERRYRDALARIDEPGGDERLRQLAKAQDDNLAWQDMLRTGEGVEIVVEGLYGFLVEGLYLTTELCALANYDPAYLMYVAYMRDSFEAYKRLLHRVGEIPELAASIQDSDRLHFLTSVLLVLGDMPRLGPDLLESLRPSIAKARRDIFR